MNAPTIEMCHHCKRRLERHQDETRSTIRVHPDVVILRSEGKKPCAGEFQGGALWSTL